MTWEASEHFERGDLATADRGYRKLLEVFPNDPLAKSLLKPLSMAAPTTETANDL
jgi:Flp pilus assembly protein TadD